MQLTPLSWGVQCNGIPHGPMCFGQDEKASGRWMHVYEVNGQVLVTKHTLAPNLEASSTPRRRQTPNPHTSPRVDMGAELGLGEAPSRG